MSDGQWTLSPREDCFRLFELTPVQGGFSVQSGIKTMRLVARKYEYFTQPVREITMTVLSGETPGSPEVVQGAPKTAPNDQGSRSMVEESGLEELPKELDRNTRKWTPELMRAGWTVFPSIILECQRTLGLSPLDVNILLHLARHWWEADNPPFPSKATIAQCIGIQARSVQRRMAHLEEIGLIERRRRPNAKGRPGANAYVFTGLIERAKPLAAAAVAARAARKRSGDASQARQEGG